MRISITLLLASASLACADSTIDVTKKYAYAANAGWVNHRPSTSGGVDFGEAFLSGFAYAANFGWIHFGDGSPANLQAYQNNSATDFGVNHDGLGGLTGYAYAANIGWINFGWASSSDSNRPRVDLSTGIFSGYAYSANIGWINLGTDLETDRMSVVDSDGDGIGDAWEIQHFSDLTTADATTSSDEDEQSDLDEYLANTDPNDDQLYLDLLLISVAPDLDEATYQIRAGAGRTLTVEHDTTPDFLTSPITKTYPPLSTAGTIDDAETYSFSLRRFFRITAELPLQGEP